MERNNLIKKGLVIGIICLLMLVSVPTVVSEDGSPDLRILELAIDYDYIPHAQWTYKIVKCRVRNFGDARTEHLDVGGRANRLIFRFIEAGSGGFSSNIKLEPEEEMWIKVIGFRATAYGPSLLGSNGFFYVYIRISVPNDLNPSDNIVEGGFIIWGDSITPL